ASRGPRWGARPARRSRRRRSTMSDAPMDGEIDRLVVQQFDVARAVTIGGIDTCIRGLLEYAPEGVELGVVGVDETDTPGRKLGIWERHHRGGRDIWFLPVARVDTTRPKGLIPHSLRLVLGLLRYRRAIPRPKAVQAHRVD